MNAIEQQEFQGLVDLADRFAGGHYHPVPDSDTEDHHDILVLANDLNLANVIVAQQPDAEVASILRRFVDRIAEFESSLVEFVRPEKGGAR